jgi:hypothetical protein
VTAQTWVKQHPLIVFAGCIAAGSVLGILTDEVIIGIVLGLLVAARLLFGDHDADRHR